MMVRISESDRKRRNVSSASHAATANKKQLVIPDSEEKKIDTKLLQYQNQKLAEKLECMKMEHMSLKSKLCRVRERQQHNDETLVMINKSVEELVEVSSQVPSNLPSNHMIS